MTPKFVVLAGVLLVIATVGSMGFVHVEVKSKHPGGEHVWIVAPAILLPAGAMVVPREKLQHHAREIRQWLPAIRAAATELERCPDGTFVQVDDPHEHVLIAKSGDALVIDVDDESETVHVAVPLGAAVYACNHLVGEAESASAHSQPI
jgi:hypothetical protein